MKQTAKSCSCYSCKRGKSSKSGNAAMKHDERKLRHAAKITLNRGGEEVPAAPKGNYYD